ncbi:hypothetical protein A2210_01105 [Candidatus Woesebacteria bacterium RIFOXYA1_FULL_40_18]|nr:MAG: hypothetical protein A2210_01105 [Candidatus Woesebacteria bacterium RIFOXYA1_FULL_40_18]
MLYFTDNELPLNIAKKVRSILRSISQDKKIPIVCSSLKKMDFGDKNIYFPHLKKGILTMFTQIMSALEHIDTDIVFFCEHDVLYNSTHFDFTPPRNDAYYYNTNVWKLWIDDEIAIRTNKCMQVSGLCGYRDLLLGHYQRKVAKIIERQKEILAKGEVMKREGFSKYMGFEPGGHSKHQGVDNYPMIPWESEWPIIDLRHGANLTRSKRHPEEFHDHRWAEGWTESNEIPGWGKVSDILEKLIMYEHI